ncbi:MAG: SPFH domain-containing protein [Planctomycetes bacterium]|nr:SPFH domain-containing protein [Planctomycetota bacterium]
MTQEKPIQPPSGWILLPMNLLAVVVAVMLFIAGLAITAGPVPVVGVVLAFFSVLSLICGIICLNGFFTLQPNEACVVSLFGPYQGTVRESGFYWVNPFSTRVKISLRSRNFEGGKLKVNDKQGNPIEIAAVTVWHVTNAAQATFDVDDYVNYVRIQSETALRHLANSFAYDHGEEHEITLRSGVDEISLALKNELQERLILAGVVVDEARLTHLAYASEIAGVMLRRQQAEAIIAARQKIVHGAVSMVEMALRELDEKQIVTFDSSQKAALASNLLVVLCSEAEAQPVINTGSAS